MVPIYATISFASYLFWVRPPSSVPVSITKSYQNHSTPLLLIRDGYESTVLTAFFYLLLTYLSPDPDEQKSVFIKVGLSRHADREARNRGEPERKWLFPLGFVKWKPEVSWPSSTLCLSLVDVNCTRRTVSTSCSS